MKMDVVILGCGFTGVRVARRMLARGARVSVTSRKRVEIAGASAHELDFDDPAALAKLAGILTPGCLVLHSVPTLPAGADAALVHALGAFPARVVYLSTTSVYGAALSVDETTPPMPRNVRVCARLETEAAVQSGRWSSLVLRPAAIYGPGRGVHKAMRNGSFRLLGDGSNFVSRIHVDDLAAHAEAALLSDVQGAFPVADAHACPSREIAAYCANLLGLPMPASASLTEIPSSRRNNRRVDGSAIRKLLGLTLAYPSYEQGIPASL